MSVRTINKVISGSTQYDGAGVKLVRVIGRADVEDFDPFLMLDAFDSSDPRDYVKGFPWHPHRGIETLTYLIKGDIEHGDSMGNEGRILDGCCQWMTAGSGVLHQEMPKPAERMLGVQLWLNLPRKDKMASPKYCDIQADKVPTLEEVFGRVGIISGQYNGTKGAVQGSYVKILFLDVEMKAGRQWKLSTEKDATLFVYIVEGGGWFAGNEKDTHPNKRALLFNPGEEFVAGASEQGMRLLLFSGKPLKEPVAWGGPIVMNTREELSQAFSELDAGTFIK